jgi:hypothetical protein
MAVNNANLALDGGDPRLHSEGMSKYPRPYQRKMHDSSVPFEEYYHYARITRAEQETGMTGDNAPAAHLASNGNEKQSKEVSPDRVSDDEWATASRAMRTASWLAVFYLITTDILGPYGVP